MQSTVGENMRIKKISARGTVFTFEKAESALGEYSCYLIEGEKRFYLCDTHLGPRSMEPVANFIAAQAASKPLVIFFSHSDWDHIWGSCAFANALVVAQELCARYIHERGSLELARYEDYQNGDVRLMQPELTFDSRLSFADDGVEYFSAPGHTADSACCQDIRDNVIYVGDLIERPEPVISWHDIEAYIATLETLGEQEGVTYISSHSGIVDKEDINTNLAYLRKCQQLLSEGPSQSEYDSSLHKQHILHLYEDAVAQVRGKDFDYTDFQQRLWHSLSLDYLQPVSALLAQVDYETLKLALESQLADL